MYTSYFQIAPATFQEQFGLGFEHLAAGQKFAHRPGVTVTQQDNLEEAQDSINAAMIHYDDQYADKTAWKKPLMVSTITVQRMIGMVSKTFGLHRKRISTMHEISLKRPVFGGDTLYAQSEVLSCEAISANLGRVRLRATCHNQRQEHVALLDYSFEMWISAGRELPGAAGRLPVMQPRFASHLQRDDGVWMEQTGLYFEDLQADETFVHFPRRSVMAQEAVTHALRSLEISPQYHDELFAAQAGQAAPLVPQTWALTLAAALSTRTFGRVTANLAWTDVQFGVDLVPGDTVEATSTILQTRTSASRPSEGIATVRTLAHNQRGDLILSYVRNLLVYKRDAVNPYAAAGY